MSTQFDTLSEEQRQRWRESVERLGLNPDYEATGRAHGITTPDYDEFASWFAEARDRNMAANLKRVRPPDLNQPVENMSPARLRKALAYHFSGLSMLDEGTLEQIRQRLPLMVADVYAAPDITVTAANPLIINSTTSIMTYGVVTITDGGYIRITVPAYFSCEQMIKVASDPSASDATFYDIQIVGADGINQPAADPGHTPGKAGNGKNAECDCCGGVVVSDGTDGSNGSDGSVGDNGLNGGNGTDALTVTLNIRQLTGFISVLNQGGVGGQGGQGGRGFDGGEGGDGGHDKTCVA